MSMLPRDFSLDPPRVGKLSSLQRVRMEMTKLYKDARSGKITTANGSRLIFMLLSIAKLIESGDLERRLEEVEAKLACLDVKETESDPHANGPPFRRA